MYHKFFLFLCLLVAMLAFTACGAGIGYSYDTEGSYRMTVRGGCYGLAGPLLVVFILLFTALEESGSKPDEADEPEAPSLVAEAGGVYLLPLHLLMGEWLDGRFVPTRLLMEMSPPFQKQVAAWAAKHFSKN